MLRAAIVVSLMIFIFSCINPPEYSPIPVISFDSISATSIRAQQDSITIFIEFTDGDGDLGSEVIPNLFFTDSRTGTEEGFKIPNITPEGNVKAITGIIAYTFPALYCTPPPPDRTLDTLSYSIYVVDRAGNKSNVITTPDIYLQCN